MNQTITYIGLDVHKKNISVASADGGLRGEVRFCYEAGPCGYGVHRHLTGLGHACAVVAPSLIPRQPGDRVKTNRRDALNLTKLHRAGALTAVWVPDEAHEAMRDLVRDRLTEQIEELLPDWSLAPLVRALQAMRGTALLVSVTLAAAVGDPSRFEHPSQLMAYLGLVPSEHSSGEKRRRGGLTKSGNAEARRVTIEAAWSYRLKARISAILLKRLEGLPKEVRDIAWKAQLRLCARYRRMAAAAGKPTPVITAAIAREMLGFAWAIAQHIEPRRAA